MNGGGLGGCAAAGDGDLKPAGLTAHVKRTSEGGGLAESL